MSSLITLPYAEATPGLSSLSPSLLLRLIASASQIIENYLQRKVIQDTVVECFSGNGENGILLADPSFVSLTSVVITECDGTENTVSTDDFIIDDGNIIYFIAEPTNTFDYTRFPRGRNNVEITYVAGMAATVNDVPADIRAAVVELILRLNTSSASPDILASGEQLGDYTIRYGTNVTASSIDGLPQSVKNTLAYYRNMIL